jgi:uncharacterized protein YdeI (YjbR/CyaY-like superfamily)
LNNSGVNKTKAKLAEKEPEPKVPADLRKVLAADPKARARWDDLTPLARWDFISWIDDAKLAETRKMRIESLPSRLASGKRRPCCFSVVPLELYSALKANPKAQTKWNALDSMPRREFIGWINAAKDKPTRKLRIEKSCAMIAAGKRKP